MGCGLYWGKDGGNGGKGNGGFLFRLQAKEVGEDVMYLRSQINYKNIHGRSTFNFMMRL